MVSIVLFKSIERTRSSPAPAGGWLACGVALLWLLPGAVAAAAPTAPAALPRPASTPDGALVLEDDEHQRLVLAGPARRIVSLAPGATAMLFAAGAGAQVVGASDFSDEPAAARRVPRVGDSRGINVERLLALQPDMVVVWSGGTAPAEIERLELLGLRVYRHRLARLEDVPGSLVRLGRLAGTEAQAQRAAADFTARLSGLQARYRHTGHAGTADGPAAGARTILLQLWDQPLYTVGGAELLSDVVATCGYRNLYADLSDPGPAVSIESVLARNPDVILALAGDPRSADAWARRWQDYPVLAAVRAGHVLPWSDARLSRLGPSMLEATEALCGALPP
jgi:iron complex transport system substrate-binding protein